MNRTKRAARQKKYAAKMPAEWTVWKGMKIRCYNSDHQWYSNYGGRGITICPRWLKNGTGFSNFLRDMGPRPGPEWDLSRLDHKGPYCPENCIWENRSSNRNSNRAAKKLGREQSGPTPTMAPGSQGTALALKRT